MSWKWTILIVCNDQVERLCILRNKFTGRNKQSNMISIGSWVIIGLETGKRLNQTKKRNVICLKYIQIMKDINF